MAKVEREVLAVCKVGLCSLNLSFRLFYENQLIGRNIKEVDKLNNRKQSESDQLTKCV